MRFHEKFMLVELSDDVLQIVIVRKVERRLIAFVWLNLVNVSTHDYNPYDACPASSRMPSVSVFRIA